MKKSRFTETQIIAILKEADAGVLVKEICQKHGISEPTYYNWKSKYGGMDASDLKRLKDMEQELNRLKRMYADMVLENRALKDLIEKALRPLEKREAVVSHCRAQPAGSAQLPLYRHVSGGLLPGSDLGIGSRQRGYQSPERNG